MQPAAGPTPPASGLTFTTRAAVLTLALLAAVLTLAFPLKQYLDQRQQIGSSQSAVHAAQQRVDALTREHTQAQQPAQIEADARERLHYTFPGQQNYLQLSPPTASAPAVSKPGHAKVPLDPGATWYARLWDSAVTAGKG